MPVTSNILEHQAEFVALVDGFDFTLTGKDQSLGRDMGGVVAQGIIDRTVADQKDADGGPLKPLNAAYRARKVKKHDVGEVGVLTGQMLSLQSVLGTVEVTADSVTIAYGTGEKPSRYATRGDVTGKEPTDRDKARYFTEGGRPFFKLDETIAADVREVVDERLGDYIRDGR